MSKVSIFLLRIFCVALMTSCYSSHQKQTPLAPLIQEYAKNNELIEQKKEMMRLEGIDQLDIQHDEESGQILVSVQLNRARLDVVLELILEETGLSYSIKDQHIHGQISAQFEKTELSQALNNLLSPFFYYPVIREGTLTIYDNVVFTQEGADLANKYISIEIPLMYLGASQAVSFLKELFPVSKDTIRLVQFSHIPGTNTLYIHGPAQIVQEAAQVIRQADREKYHVIIEILVIEYSREDLEEVSVRFHDLSSGNMTFGSLDIGSLVESNAIFSFLENAKSPTSFTAMMDYLILTEKARIVTRPYLSALSGESADLAIGNERQLVVETAQNGAAIASLETVKAGFSLHITPTILPDNRILIDVDVENSEFVPSLGNVASEKRTRHANTTMTVEDGQSIIIGGFTFDQKTDSRSGIPYLRNIPILETIFSDRDQTTFGREVVFIVVPYIWSPGLVTPMPVRKPIKALDGELDTQKPLLEP